MGKAYQAFKDETSKDRPTFILVHSHIGYGSSKQDTSKAHGSPLGPDVIKAWKEKFGVSTESFVVPDGVYEHFQDGIGKKGKASSDGLVRQVRGVQEGPVPAEAKQIDQIERRQLPEGWDKDLPRLPGRRQGDGRAQGVAEDHQPDRPRPSPG